MRGAADVPMASSLRDGLPPAFFGSDFTADLVAAFDEVLAPVVATLDDLDAYVDPRYAPDDFVRWLGTWLVAPVDERWPAHRVRAHLPDIRDALLRRGTVTGLAAMLRAVTGNEPEISDSGGVATSPRPMGPLPGVERAFVRVRVSIPDEDPDTMEDVVSRIVTEMTPAHVPVDVVTVRV